MLEHDVPECAFPKWKQFRRDRDDADEAFRAAMAAVKDQEAVASTWATAGEIDPKLPSARKAKLAQGELEQRIQIRSRRDQERRHRIAIFNNVDNWLDEHFSSCAFEKLIKARSPGRVTFSADAFEEKRNEIAELQIELDRVRACPRTRASLEHEVAAFVDRLRGGFRIRASEPREGIMRAATWIQRPKLFTLEVEVALQGVMDPNLLVEPNRLTIYYTLALQAWLDPEGLTRKFLAAIPENADLGIDPKRKAEFITELSAKLLACERREEALIEAAIAAGVVVQRRVDADPRTLLGVDVVKPNEAAAA